MSRNSIEGKVVLIAGGAKNLGGLLARKFAKSRAKAIAIHYNSDATKAAAEETIAAIESAGAEAVAFQADLTSAAAMEKLFADTVAAVGRPDIAINTVGMVVKKPMAEVTEEVFDQSCAVNVKSAFFFLSQSSCLLEQLQNLCVFDTQHLR